MALALLVAAAFAAPARAQADDKGAALRLATTPWSPFTNAPGKPRVAIDLVHKALERVGVSVNTATVAEGSLTAALFEGRYDGSPALWRDPEREKRLIYSKPYLENRLVLVARQGTDVSAASLGALQGKRVAIVDGYAYGDALKTPNGPTYVSAPTVENSLQKVLAKEADYALMDDLVVEYLVTNYPDQATKRLAIGSKPMFVRTLHFAVRRDMPGAQGIVDRFDAELIRMIADHSYHRLLQVGWIQADVDGDGRTEWVPASDKAGKEAPERRYALTSLEAEVAEVQPSRPAKKRFYLGGQVYEDWASVPERYKVMDTNRTAWGAQVVPMFTFKW